MYEYKYGICSIANEDVFCKQCAALEKCVPNIIKGKFTHSVFNDKVQEYSLDSKKIKVVNDNYVNDVHIESEIDLTHILKKKVF